MVIKSVRNYKQENENYNSRPEQIANRVKRNKARAEAIKDGRVSKGDGKEIDHKKKLIHGGSNAKSNTRVVSKSTNRSFPRTKTAGAKK